MNSHAAVICVTFTTIAPPSDARDSPDARSMPTIALYRIKNGNERTIIL